MKLKQTKISDVSIPLVLALFSAYVYYIGRGYTHEAGLFPVIVSSLTLLLSLMLAGVNALQLYKGRGNGNKEAFAKPMPKHRNFWITIPLMTAYPLVIILIGFFPATVVYMLASFYCYNYRKIKVIIPTTAGLTLFIYLLFVKILMVNLPIGMLFGGVLY